MELDKKNKFALVALRNYLALTMIIHACTRIYVGGVLPFGEFLTLKSFPVGFYLAWAITLFELFGGVVLIAGYLIKTISLIFVFQLVMGIILVHSKEGWFVVGLGRNGMEYSVLLIVAFFAVSQIGFLQLAQTILKSLTWKKKKSKQ